MISSEAVPLTVAPHSAQGEIKLANGIAIGYAQVNAFLSILYLVNMDHHPGAPTKVHHNVLVTKETILRLLEDGTR